MADAKSKLQPDTPLLSADPLLSSEPSNSSAVVGYLVAFAMTAVATVLAVSVSIEANVPNLSLIFVVPVVIAGVAFGLGPSLFSAVLGALAYNFFLTEPRYSLMVKDPANIWAIALLFVIGLIVSGVAYTSRRRATDAALLRRQAIVLQCYSRDVVAADNTETIVSLTSEALAALFQVPVVVMLVAEGKVFSVKKAFSGLEPQEAEFEMALSSLATGTVVRAGIYPALSSRFDFWPVATTVGQRAVIGLAFDPDERPAAPDTAVDIVRSVMALALERQHSPVSRDARSER
jgi:K+-sensing histidine kinase KdpD